MNEIVEVSTTEKIKGMIFIVRGKQVIADRDLAKLYDTETKIINQSVKRNIARFPEKFCFQLNEEEFIDWKSQFVTSKSDKIGLRKRPYVFTEQGVAMLSAILKSNVAIQTSIAIIDTFVEMRRFISTNLLEQRYINDLVLEDHDRIKLLETSFSKFEEKKKDEIYFAGQIYDAYSKIKDILKEAKKDIVIIDAYADKTVLDIIKDINVNVTLIVKTKTLLTPLDISRYNSQYNNLTIKYNDSFHDRYFILDNSKIYHCGTSINRIGSKTFSINIIEDDIIKQSLLTEVKKFYRRSIHINEIVEVNTTKK